MNRHQQRAWHWQWDLVLAGSPVAAGNQDCSAGRGCGTGMGQWHCYRSSLPKGQLPIPMQTHKLPYIWTYLGVLIEGSPQLWVASLSNDLVELGFISAPLLLPSIIKLLGLTASQIHVHWARLTTTLSCDITCLRLYHRHLL